MTPKHNPEGYMLLVLMLVITMFVVITQAR